MALEKKKGKIIIYMQLTRRRAHSPSHLALKPYFEERAHDDKDVVDTYKDVPEVYKFHSLL